MTASITAGTVAGTFNLTLTSPSGQTKTFTGLTPSQAVAAINAAATIAIASYPTLVNPTGSVTTTPSTTGGQLSGGTIYGVYTWTNANGETLASAEFTVTIAAGSTGSFTFKPPTAPTGATGYKLYLGTSSGAETLAATATTATATTTVTTLPTTGYPIPPTTNTASIVPSTVPAAGTFNFANGSNGVTPVDGDYIGTTLPNGQKTGLAALATAPQLAFVMAELVTTGIKALLSFHGF